MNPAPPTRRQHLLAVGVRLAAMLAITLAGPLVGTGANPELSGGPEQAPGVAGLLFLVGVGAALLYGILGSLTHFFLRRKPVKLILLVDTILAAGFILLMVYNGMTARRGTGRSSPASIPMPARLAADLHSSGWR